MTEKRAAAPVYQTEPTAETNALRNNSSITHKYKKITTEKCQCSFACCTCHIIGNDLIKSHYKNSNDILLEDDSKLILQTFGRDLTRQ